MSAVAAPCVTKLPMEKHLMTQTSRTFAALVFIAAAILGPRQGLAQVGSKPLFLRGDVFASIQFQTSTASFHKDIALPHASVFLVAANNLSTPIASALSDLSGRFMLKTDQNGIFRLCIEAEGIKRFCPDNRVALEPTQRVTSVTLLVPVLKESATEGLAYGKVTFQSGEFTRTFQPSFGINAYPTIELLTHSGSRFNGFVNNFGEYIVPQIPVKEDFTIKVTIEKQTTEREIKAQTGLIASRAYEFDFVLPNSPPRIRAVTATSDGKPIQIPAPGSTVALHAVSDDRDGDKLEYRWLLPDGRLVGPSPSPDLNFTIPSQRGSFPVSAMASDQRGGYSRNDIVINASNAGAPFSGTVVDAFGQPINGALVEVNGRLANTNFQGWFSFTVPVEDRYVLTIRSPGVEMPNQNGFGTESFVYKSSITGGRWAMRRAQVTTVDPTQPITLQHRRDERDCLGMVSSQIDWTPYLKPGMFQWQDGRGNVLALPDLGVRDPKSVQETMRLVSRINGRLVSTLAEATGVKTGIEGQQLPCTPGIAVEIPPNSLIDLSTNRAPNGPVQISLSTVALTSPYQMPGDYTAIDSNGKTLAMESYGAGSIEIGAGAARYNLKPGATATVTIPVDVQQIAGGASLPPKIPFLFYDERQGVWNQNGEATLAGSGTNATYKVTVPHLSTMNADILKSGQSCVAVELDAAANFTLPLNVEVVMQPSKPNPNVIQVRTLTVDSTKSNVIYNLPNNSDIVLTPIISGTLPDGSTGNVPAGVFVVNTGGPQSSAVTPPPANADGTYYGEDSGGQPTGPCAARITLTKLSPVTIANGFEYLQGLHFEASAINEFNQTIGAAIESGATDYYNQADPRHLRNSFNQFKQKNKFGQPTTATDVEYKAQYANSGDLGFGRDMHCRRNLNPDDGKFDYACYVTNFGQPPANNPDQQDANDVLDPAKQPGDATVAMEFSRVENAAGDPIEFPDNDRAVKFYVYDTKNPNNPPLTKAELDLDHHGPRPVPQLCMVCHGGIASSVAADPSNPAGPKKGAFSARSDIISMGSNFLPFDLHLFNFPLSKSKNSQQAAFKNLDVDIVKGVTTQTGTGSAIVEVIDTSFYAGGSATQLEDQVIAGWDPANVNSNRHRFYRDVFARACRTCHTSRPFGAPTFVNATDFENAITNVQNRVCVQHVMPHAQRTNDIFWNSLNPSMPALLTLYGQTLPGWSTQPDSQCSQGPVQGGGNAPSVFASQMYPILFHNCTGCHSVVGNANYAVGNVPNTYNSLLTATAKNGTSKYIVPHDPVNSLLYHRITNDGPGASRMPLGGPNLAVTDTDIPPDGVFDASEINAWINAGAPGP